MALATAAAALTPGHLLLAQTGFACTNDSGFSIFKNPQAETNLRTSPGC